MNGISSITLEVPDPTAARAFYSDAFGLNGQLSVRAGETPTRGFRGFTMSLVVSQPSTVDSLVGAAVEAGASPLKPVVKTLWGYGGVVQAPDGAIWKVATSSKKYSGPATLQIDEVVLLIGVTDVLASKRFYVERGFTVKKSFGRKYVQFDADENKIKLGLYGRRALAKDAGVPPDGSGSHRMVISNNGGSFADLDGFTWEQ